jgi:hypothetical protein
MSSRALILATVMLLMGCLATGRALAQVTNLEAGKSPAQIFAGTCTACHKAPRGLLKSVPASSLSSFLRQHYTTSPEMAGVLASYLISNGASDTRVGGGEKRGAKEGTREARQEARPEQLDRSGRRVHPGGVQVPEATPMSPGESPSQAAIEAAREQNARQKLSKRNKPGEELPRGEGAKETPAPGDTAKLEDGKPESSKPSEAPSQSANATSSAPGETSSLRPAPVTPAPAASSEPAQASTPTSVISAAISAETAPAVPSPSKPVEPPPAVVAATALPPVSPAGPPAPPISQ